MKTWIIFQAVPQKQSKTPPQWWFPWIINIFIWFVIEEVDSVMYIIVSRRLLLRIDIMKRYIIDMFATLKARFVQI